MNDATPLPQRLWQYSRERFPLVPSALTAVFLAGAGDFVVQVASSDLHVRVDGRSAVAVVTVLAALFALRVFDEHKDLEVDTRAYPARPVQRGLVRLSELFAVAAVVTAAVLIANAVVGIDALAAALALSTIVLLLWRELFLREWLRRHPFVYLATHQAVVPAMLGYAAVVRGVSEGDLPALALACVMAVGASVAFEVGRKTRAPEEETDAAESYSREIGPVGAALVSLGALLTSIAAAIALASLLSLPTPYVVVVAIGGALVAVPFLRFAAHPTRERAKPLLAAGASVALVTYAPLLCTVAAVRGVALAGVAP